MEISSQPIGTSLGQLLRERRCAAGWTQRELAEAAGVSVGVVRDLEQGISQRPRPGSWRRLAGALGGHGPDPAARGPGRAEPLTIQVLGPLRVWRRGIPLPLGGGKQRAVLGLLGLHPDTVVSRGAIGAVLWGDDAPHNAAPIIQSHMSRLRTALDPAGSHGQRGGLLGTAGAGYLLRSDRAVLDLVTYRRLAERARAALRPGDAAVACELFEQALDVWRDEPAADVELLAGHPWVTSLQLQRAELLVEYAEAASGQGWHDRVLPHLQALAEHDPLNERVHACLMIALAGAGRQAAALELYARLRRRLNDQLGVQPGAALAAAHMRVLRRQIPPRAAPGRTASVSRGPAAGAGLLPRPFQLPPSVADFTGRAEQIAQLDVMLRPDGSRSAVPVVVLSGPPGVGKTTLMVHVAQVMRRFFPDGQLWAQAAGFAGSWRHRGVGHRRAAGHGRRGRRRERAVRQIYAHGGWRRPHRPAPVPAARSAPRLRG